MLHLGLATSNKHKLIETQACLSALGLIEHQDYILTACTPTSPVEETGNTFEANARLKLDDCLNQIDCSLFDYLFAEDSGLVVPSLDKTFGLSPFPGIYSDRWLDNPEHQRMLLGTAYDELTYTEKNEALLTLLNHHNDRSAYYITVLVYWDKATQTTHCVEGRMALKVSSQPDGTGGFGYDPIMQAQLSDGTYQTIALLTLDEKCQMSHRFHALNAWYKAISTPTLQR